MINWRYIKGMNQAGTGIGTEDQTGAREGELETLYTFLYFKRNSDATFPDFEFVPGIAINDTNSFNIENNHDLGHIITQKASGQHIDTAFTFNDYVNIHRQIPSGGRPLLNFYSSLTDDDCVLSLWSAAPSDASQRVIFNMYKNLYFAVLDNGVGYNMLKFFVDASNRYVEVDNGPLKVKKYLNIGDATSHTDTGSLSAKVIYSDGDIIAGTNGKCQALYFNATSDRRAKDNLKILNFKALDLINHTNLYSFTYKDTNTPSIGIIAQDVQNVNIEGFKLVDNENATGQDMDYMSVHESKLVYILWQAIKEQQKEIEELKKRLN